MDDLIGQVHNVDSLPINYCARTRQVKVEIPSVRPWAPLRLYVKSCPICWLNFLFIYFSFCTEKMEEADVQRPSPEHVQLRLFNWTKQKALQLRAHAPSQADVVAVGGLNSSHPSVFQHLSSRPLLCQWEYLLTNGRNSSTCHDLYSPKRLATVHELSWVTWIDRETGATLTIDIEKCGGGIKDGPFCRWIHNIPSAPR